MWKVGDRAIIVNCPGWVHYGKETTLLRRSEITKGNWVLDIQPTSGFKQVGAREYYLKHIDDYDGYKVTSWDERVWQPKVLEPV